MPCEICIGERKVIMKQKENVMTIGNLFIGLDGDAIIRLQISGVTVYVGEKDNMDEKYLRLHVDRWYVTSYTVVIIPKEKNL